MRGDALECLGHVDVSVDEVGDFHDERRFAFVLLDLRGKAYDVLYEQRIQRRVWLEIRCVRALDDGLFAPRAISVSYQRSSLLRGVVQHFYERAVFENGACGFLRVL